MQYDKVKISVIVPCYNVEKYIARCLESLINQDIEQSYEIVVVNDGTKDNSAVIAQEYADKYSDKVRVLHKVNGGLSSARNYGIDHSDSEYIAFVDSDDYVSSDFLSTLYNLSKMDNADISMCGVIRTNNSNYIGRRFPTGFNCNQHHIDTVTLIKKSSFAAWNKLYKRYLFDTLRYPEGINYEDYALTPRLFLLSKCVSYTHKACLYYYENTESIIGSMKGKVDWNIMKAFKILNDSELSRYPALLNILYIRRVVLSLTKTIIMNSGVDDLRKVYNETRKNYCYIRNDNSCCLSLFDKLYTYCFINGYLKICILMQKGYCIIYNGVKKIMSTTHII